MPLAAPGGLVRARGREWVVLPGSGPDRLRLRPLSGAESEATTLIPSMELDPPQPARFAAPDGSRLGTSTEARLLADALRLNLRRGAGPFRSSAQIAFEPQSYQLVPLIMALRLDPARLLIADDMGIGKTIEAGLILRELWDRGEVARACILCPPHLVEQWVDELAVKFDLHATAVTATTAPRLERGLGLNESPFEAHPLAVVSLDYIKAERRREEFARFCPPLVIVDEAHACVGGGRGATQRQALLTRLAFVAPRVLELTYTSHALAPFARDLGHHGPPFPWDPDRRAGLRADLDAFYARAYGLDRDDLRYILDPAWVMGADYPSETFRVLRDKDIRRHGEYRTGRRAQDWAAVGL